MLDTIVKNETDISDAVELDLPFTNLKRSLSKVKKRKSKVFDPATNSI